MNEYQKILSEYNDNPLLNNKSKREFVSKNYDYIPSQKPNINTENNNINNNMLNNMNYNNIGNNINDNYGINKENYERNTFNNIFTGNNFNNIILKGKILMIVLGIIITLSLIMIWK